MRSIELGALGLLLITAACDSEPVAPLDGLDAAARPDAAARLDARVALDAGVALDASAVRDAGPPPPRDGGDVARKLVSMTLDGLPIEIPRGDTRSLRAVGSYSDGVVEDITAATAFRSSGPIQLGERQPDGVPAVGVEIGTAQVTLLAEGLAPATFDVEVVAPRVVSLRIEADRTTLARGATSALTAIARFTDGTLSDVTSTALWTSSDPMIAAVDVGVVECRDQLPSSSRRE